MVSLSIIIPAYNEEKVIEKTINTYAGYLDQKLKNDYEIIVVPNGCTDNTVKIVNDLSKRHKQLRCFDMGCPGSKGMAVIKGFELASGDLIGFVDADLSSPPNAFYELVLNIKGNDGIIASRSLKESKISVRQPLSRRILGRGFKLLVNLFLDLNHNDTQCGCKLFKKEAIKKVYQDLMITGWAFDINLLYLMKLNNFKVLEIPTIWNDAKGTSKLNVKKAVPEMFFSILKLRLSYPKNKT